MVLGTGGRRVTVVVGVVAGSATLVAAGWCRGRDGCVAEQEQRAGTSSFADRLNRLFVELDGGARSNDEVADAITQAGTSISGSYLWLLRTGRRDNPGKNHLEAIAAFFGVPPAYFFGEETARQIDAELSLIAAMRRAGVRDLALRAADLSAESLQALTVMVEQARRLERLEQNESQPD